MKFACRAGMSTVEALVAIALLGIIGSSTTRAISQALSIRASSTRLLRAAQHGMAVVEHLHGDSPGLPTPPPGFDTEVHLQPLSQPADLERYRVVVAWIDRGEKLLALEGLLWRRR